VSLQRNLLESKALQANNDLECVVAGDANFPVSTEPNLDLHATTATRKHEPGDR
jgi:hypothetical protein